MAEPGARERQQGEPRHRVCGTLLAQQRPADLPTSRGAAGVVPPEFPFTGRRHRRAARWGLVPAAQPTASNCAAGAGPAERLAEIILEKGKERLQPTTHVKARGGAGQRRRFKRRLHRSAESAAAEREGTLLPLQAPEALGNRAIKAAAAALEREEMAVSVPAGVDEVTSACLHCACRPRQPCTHCPDSSPTGVPHALDAQAGRGRPGLCGAGGGAARGPPRPALPTERGGGQGEWGVEVSGARQRVLAHAAMPLPCTLADSGACLACRCTNACARCRAMAGPMRSRSTSPRRRTVRMARQDEVVGESALLPARRCKRAACQDDQIGSWPAVKQRWCKARLLRGTVPEPVFKRLNRRGGPLSAGAARRRRA